MVRTTPTTEERLAHAMRRKIWDRLAAGDAKVVTRMLDLAAGKATPKAGLSPQELEVLRAAVCWLSKFARDYAWRRPNSLPTPGNIAAAVRRAIARKTYSGQVKMMRWEVEGTPDQGNDDAGR